MPNPSTIVADEEAKAFEPSEADSVEPRPTNPTANADLDTGGFEELPAAVDVVVRESKAGYKTTEFWITVITALSVAFDGVPLPESKEGFVLAGLAAVYAVARGLAKRGTPHVEPADAGTVDPVV